MCPCVEGPHLVYLSSVDGRSCCFCFWGFMNDAAVNVQVSWWTCVFVFLESTPVSWWTCVFVSLGSTPVSWWTCVFVSLGWTPVSWWTCVFVSLGSAPRGELAGSDGGPMLLLSRSWPPWLGSWECEEASPSRSRSTLSR